MGRHASTAVQPISLIGPNEAVAIDAKATQAGAMATADTLLRELLEGGAADALIAVGRIQAATVAAAIADAVIADAYDKVAKSGAYKGLPYRDKDGAAATVSSLDEFCQVFLGHSARRCRQLAANRALVGADLYEAAAAVGFRNQDYTALRALPADDQEAVRLALAEEDKDRALEVLSDLVTRQATQKAAFEDAARVAQGERDEARRDYEAASALLGQSKAKIRRMEGGDLRPLRLDEQMAQWPAGCGALIGEIRRHLTQIGLIIQSAEQLPIPEAGTPEADIHSRAMRLLFDSLSAPLSDLASEVSGVDNHLNRIVGAFAYPGEDAPLQGTLA